MVQYNPTFRRAQARLMKARGYTDTSESPTAILEGGATVAVALALVAHNLTVAEERYLEAELGDAWREYRSRVRRWI